MDIMILQVKDWRTMDTREVITLHGLTEAQFQELTEIIEETTSYDWR
jgi:hypothetical protein